MQELRFKLLERRAKILSFYKQHSSAREAYKQTMKALDDAKAKNLRDPKQLTLSSIFSSQRLLAEKEKEKKKGA